MAVFNNIEETEINGKFVIIFSVSSSRSFKGRKTFETMPLNRFAFEPILKELINASNNPDRYEMFPFSSASLFEVAKDGTKEKSIFSVFEKVRVI